MNQAFTILAGIALYVTGQLLSKFFIEPIYEMRKSIGAVRFALSFHAPVINTPMARSPESSEETRNELSKCSSDLFASLQAIPLARHVPLWMMPRASDVRKAAVALRVLSTYVFEHGVEASDHVGEVRAKVAEIESLLQLAPID